MKSKRILISLIVAMFLISAFCIYTSFNSVYADNLFYPEPEHKSEIPANLIWNTYTNEYYDSDVVSWDTEKKQYALVIKENQIKENDEMMIDYRSPEQWIEDNKNSTNAIDQAIISYYNESKLCYEKNPNLAARSFYSPDEDPVLYIMVDLGIEYLPEMIKRIENNDIWSGLLMTSVAQIANIKELSFVSVVPDDMKKWISDLNNRILTAQSRVQSGNDIIGSGVFALPYIMDELNNGNDSVIKHLPDILYKCYNLNKEELVIKDKVYWINWFNEHKNEVEVLRNIK